ncbi:MAG: LacI family DNA-binding transcriptional regulator [Litorimonas sp.]
MGRRRDSSVTEDGIAEAVVAAKVWKSAAGTRKATINDVAAIAGVSKKTISRIINDNPKVREQTRQQVKAIMAEIGYVPNPQARGLNFSHAFLVGLIYDNPNPQYVVTAQEGILKALQGTEYELLVYPCDRSDPDFVEKIRAFILRQRLYGVILTPSVSEDPGLGDVLREIGCRHIRIASVQTGLPEHSLVTHDAAGAEQAADHLVGLGHRRIGYLSGLDGFRSSEERQKGLEAGLAKAGLRLDPAHIVSGDYTFESGRAAAERFFALDDPPTAVFCGNDQMAAGMLQGLRLSGRRAPDDMSIVGYDDFDVARTVWPRLTTVHTPTGEFAQKAAHRLLEAEQPSELDAVTEPWLVVRDSTAPPAR